MKELKTKFFTMRISPSLHQKLHKEAAKECRNISSQINYIIAEWFKSKEK
jgi:hypothetical protein